MIALLAALALAASPLRAQSGRARPAPPAAERAPPAREEPPRPPPPPPAVDPANDPDEEVIRNLQLLESMELLEHLEVFDPKADDAGDPQVSPP